MNCGLWNFTSEWLSYANCRKLKEYESNQDILFILCRQKSDIPLDIRDYLKRQHYGYTFVIYVDSMTSEQANEINCYITLKTTVRGLTDLMYDCFLFGPISDAFKGCYDYFNREETNTDQYFREAFTVSTPINVALPDSIELDMSYTPIATRKGVRISADKISYRSQRTDIVDVCQNRLIGKSEGRCLI